jgi:hypothetical protein
MTVLEVFGTEGADWAATALAPKKQATKMALNAVIVML